MSHNYYQILGVDRKATLDTIKKAYRRKAKELHPDVNKGPSAQEDFISLNEAYEYLKEVRTGKIRPSSSRARTNTRKTSTARRRRTYEEWQREERERVRQVAREHAKMRFEEFKKTDAYKATDAFLDVADFFFYILAVLIVVGAPVGGTFLLGIPGLLVGLFISFITIPIWVPVLKQRSKVSLSETIESFRTMLNYAVTWLFIGGGLQIYILLKIGLNTFIPVLNEIVLLAILIFAGFLVSYFLKLKLAKKYLSGLVFFPSVLSLFLLVNYTFSSHRVVETYAFRNVMVRSNAKGEEGRIVKGATIALEGNKYSEYGGLRFFYSPNVIEEVDYITYYIEEGLFGYRVVKDYQFQRSKSKR